MLGAMKMDEQKYILEAEKKVLDIKGLPERPPAPISLTFSLDVNKFDLETVVFVAINP